MKLETTTEAALLPVTLEEAKEHLGFIDDEGEHDALITRLVAMATGIVEDETNIRFMPQEVTLRAECFPEGGVDLGVYPVKSIDSFTYVDAEGNAPAQLTNGGADYWQSLTGMYPYVAPADTWPATQAGNPEAVEIVLTVGYLTREKVPIVLKGAIMIMVEELFNNRGETIEGRFITPVSRTVKMMVSPYRRISVV